jgi:hypothetical protein
MQVVLKERVFPQISVCHIYIKMNTTAREMRVRQEETAKNSRPISNVYTADEMTIVPKTHENMGIYD